MADTLVIGEDSAQFAGFSFLSGFLDKILGSIKFDRKKVDPKELKLAVASAADGFNGAVTHVGKAFKPAVDAPLGADDLAIDKICAAEIEGMKWVVDHINAGIDAVYPPGGGFSALGDLSLDDADNYINALSATEKAFSGSNSAPQFSAKSIELLRANPNVVRLLEKTTRARQIRAMSDSTFMQKVIDFFYKYGPYMAQILSFMLLFL